MDTLEQIIFDIISYGGIAKGLVYEAIAASEKGEFDKAQELLKEADENMNKAHQVQTDIIQDEARGNHHDVTVLFVHAQDHLMTAMETRSLAEIIIRQNKRLYDLENNNG